MTSIFRDIKYRLGKFLASCMQESTSEVEVLCKVIDRDLYENLPSPAKVGDAAMDLRAAVKVTVEPGEEILIPTGICLYTGNDKVVGLLFPRSSFRKYKCSVGNMVGVIDSGYQGEIMFSVHNISDEPVTFNRGDRICQIMYVPVLRAVNIRVTDYEVSDRGSAGYGSTGK